MPATVIATRQPADASQRGILQKLFDSAQYSLLKEMLAAHCIDSQVNCMNAIPYKDENPFARQDVDHGLKQAKMFNAFLDFLDDFEKKEEKWFTVKLEHRR